MKCYYDASEQRLTVEILHAADIIALDANGKDETTNQLHERVIHSNTTHTTAVCGNKCEAAVPRCVLWMTHAKKLDCGRKTQGGIAVWGRLLCSSHFVSLLLRSE